jgi:hypothetical protein
MSSKAREVLENVRSLIYEGIETEVDDDIEHPFHLELAIEKIDEALAEPLRNCEVGTAEEQYTRFNRLCTRFADCKNCPIWRGGLVSRSRCLAYWAHMPYEEEK